MSFTDLLQNSTQPWDDATGFWATYNAAIGAMFESIFQIVADRGDITYSPLATLSEPLSTGTTVSSIPVQGLSQPIDEGTEIIIVGLSSWQDYTTSADVAAFSSSIPVNPHTPIQGGAGFTYPVGSAVQLDYVPGWSSLLDPDDCPDSFLSFLAQFNGTQIPVGVSPASARQQILYESGLRRGTLGAIQSAVVRNLSGTQSCFIQERLNTQGNADAYWFIVIVRPEQIIDINALTNAVNAVKPGGVQWTLVQTDTWDISQMEASQSSIAALEGNFVTITGLEQDKPGT